MNGPAPETQAKHPTRTFNKMLNPLLAGTPPTVKPPQTDRLTPTTLDAAVAALTTHPGARALAGVQHLAMKPAPSDHLAPDTLDATLAALAADPSARILARGQAMPASTSP